MNDASEQEIDEARPVGLFADVLKLHMSITGASDPLDPGEEKAIIGRISRTLVEWRASTPKTLHFDECVRSLLNAVIAEWHES